MLRLIFVSVLQFKCAYVCHLISLYFIHPRSGIVLNVCREGETLPVAFYSRQLDGTEHRYSVTELEALAMLNISLWDAVYCCDWP